MDNIGQFNNIFNINFLNQLMLQNMQSDSQIEGIGDTFKKIETKELSNKDNLSFNYIHNETKDISEFFNDSINKFYLIFDKNFKDFEESLKYLEDIAIPNKCVCAGAIETIPGWRCDDCSKYGNTIYCNDCYIKSKNLHKNHKVFFLYSSSGMCDCGDPDSLYTYCPEHSGPFKDQKQIDDYISKVFSKEILDKLNSFFATFFFRFSKYLVLTEKCDYFYKDYFEEKYNANDEPLLSNEKEDFLLIRRNFGIVYQNLITFLRLISHKNLGMLHLLANFLLKSHLDNQKLEDEFMTTHRCLKITEKEIKLFYTDKQKHICICPFFRLFLTNYRDGINCEDENKEFLLSFAHNLPLRTSFCVIFFATYRQIILNANEDFIINRNQFFLEDATVFIAKKSNLIEESYDFFYDYLLKYFKSPKIITFSGSINEGIIMSKLLYPLIFINTDTKYFCKPKMRKLMTEKTSIMKRIIDCVCLIHNQNEFKSIYPHPQFQNKSFSSRLIDFEFRLLGIVEEFTMFIEWEKINYLKDIFKYLINKILNQEKEGIKILQNDEYTYHLGLYRCFEIFMNSFCFNYAFNNKCTLIEAINFFKQTFFESQNEVETLVDIIIKDYFKFFGFIIGGGNNFFNYYESVSNYSRIYFLTKESNLMDFSLLKYLIIMTDKNVDIISFLKISNLEEVYSSFEKAFILKNDEKNEKIQIEEDNKEDNKNNNTESNIDNNNSIEPPQINLEFFEFLRNQNQRQITPQVLEQLIFNNRNNRNNDKSRDEYNCIMQWEHLLDLLIVFMKDDSSPYWNLMRIYNDAISSKTEKDLFDVVKNNNFAIQDLKNILKEKLIQEIIAQGNLTNMENISKKIDKHLQKIFEENNEFNKTIDELTYNKMNGEIKMIYLKDAYLKHFDSNYYISKKDKSDAQKYILDFKKDYIKTYNFYYFNPSKLTFEFFENVFEKILLNENNLELMIKIIEKLLDNKKVTEELDIKSVRNSLLPVILNYLTIFSVINTKSFIEFKNKNKNLISQISELLSNSVKNNKNNIILEKELEENVKVVINELNWYQIIDESINSDFSKLNKYDYNCEVLQKLKEKEKKEEKNKNKINIIPGDMKNIDENKKKGINMKNKLKNLMKKRADIFMDKVASNKEMIKAINDENKKREKINIENEMMCFYCRNPIKLDSFEVPYGKIGLLIEDYFYNNSLKSTIKSELSKLLEKNKNKDEIYSKIIDNTYNDLFHRIISCSHYVHSSCYKEGCNKKNNNIDDEEREDKFTCPLCLKNQNILIPPLNSFKENNLLLSTEILQGIFDEKIDLYHFNSNIGSTLFKETIEDFLKKINLNIIESKDYISFLNNKYPTFKGFFNYLENVFYINGTTFHKLQQIDTIQNIILSLRLIIRINSSYINQIIHYINCELTNLVNGPNNEYIFNHTEFMRYADLLEKILLSLIILFDYEEIEESFKYIIYIFLPYFSFGFYFRELMFKKEFKNIDKFKFKEKMNINDLKNYLKNNNNHILNYFNGLLKKFCLIKVISDYSNKNQEIINSFNELTLDNLFSLLNMENLYKLLPIKSNNEINFIDIIDNFPKIFNKDELFFKKFGNLFDFNKVFNTIFLNVKANEKEESIYEKELIIQFAPIKFNLTYLDNNIFDFIERNLGQKCDICKKVTKYSYICLICGDKVCHIKSRPFEVDQHGKMCGEKYCIFVDMDNMDIILWTSNNIKKIFPLYVNKEGTGPEGSEIGNEFNLSHEKLNLLIKNFVCNDFH